jgi:hypothetical protein
VTEKQHRTITFASQLNEVLGVEVNRLIKTNQNKTKQNKTKQNKTKKRSPWSTSQPPDQSKGRHMTRVARHAPSAVDSI